MEDLVGTLPRALQYYQQGIQEAWGSSENRSCSGPAEWNHGSLSQATFLLANGHVRLERYIWAPIKRRFEQAMPMPEKFSDLR